MYVVYIQGFLTGKDTVKVLPLSTSLSTDTVPLCISASFFTRDNPSPVPLYFRLMAESICLKGSNSFCWSSFEIPIPVSCTEKYTNPSFWNEEILIVPPSGVNLIAFPVRLYNICFSLLLSASELLHAYAWSFLLHSLNHRSQVHKLFPSFRRCQIIIRF